MANTIADIRVAKTAYSDVYAVTGIAIGTPLIIQNKSSSGIYVQIKPTIPLATSVDGFFVNTNEACIVEGEISKVWVIGAGAVCVQIYE